MQMKISKRGLDFIKGWEMFVGYVYDDKVPARRIKGKRTYPEYKGGPVKGTLTIGYGHTKAAKAVVDMDIGAKMTEAEASRVLDIDLDDCEAAVNRRVKVPITQGQFDALTSFTLNCGEGNLRKLIVPLNKGDYAGCRRKFDQFVRSKGEFMQGLQNRRDAEQVLWDEDGNIAKFIPDEEVETPRGVEQTPPPKTMAKSVEGAAHATQTGIGVTGDGKEIADAAGHASAALDKVIDAKDRAEALGLDVSPVSIWDYVGPFVSHLIHSPVFWVCTGMIVIGAIGFYRRRKRLYEELV